MSTWLITLIVVVVVAAVLVVVVATSRARRRRDAKTIGLPPSGTVAGGEPLVSEPVGDEQETRGPGRAGSRPTTR